MLSEDSFTVGTNDYTIDAIFVEGGVQESSTAETLRFSLTSTLTTADKAGLVLHAGGSSFAFRESTFFNNEFYSWSSTGLDWSTEATVTLRLTVTATVPTISSVAVTSTPALTSPGGSMPDTYGEGDTIRFTVTFSEPVEVTGDPQFGFSLAGARAADYDSGSGTARLVFAYNVQSSDTDANGIWVGDHTSGNPTLQLDAGDAITSLGGDDANLEHDELGTQSDHKVDGSRISGNVDPQFPDANTTRSVPENSPAGTAVGAVVTATDANDDTLTYSLEGTDERSFTIDSSAGQIETRSGVSYNYEAKPSYSVTVRADDGEGGSDTIGVTINVDGRGRAAGAAGAAEGAGDVGRDHEPGGELVGAGAERRAGDHRLRGAVQGCREQTIGWSWRHSDTATNTTITGLPVGAEYQVRVRALNGEMESDWSASGSATDAEDEPGVGPPTPPRDLRATGADRSVSLGWRAPVDDGGARIVRYEYRQQAGDGPPGDWQIIWDRRGEESHVTTRRHRVTGLANGTSYTFELRAVNNGGWASRPSGSRERDAGGRREHPGSPPSRRPACCCWRRCSLPAVSASGDSVRCIDGAARCRSEPFDNALPGSDVSRFRLFIPFLLLLCFVFCGSLLPALVLVLLTAFVSHCMSPYSALQRLAQRARTGDEAWLERLDDFDPDTVRTHDRRGLGEGAILQNPRFSRELHPSRDHQVGLAGARRHDVRAITLHSMTSTTNRC